MNELMKIYERNLAADMAANPDDFWFDVTRPEFAAKATVEKMRPAIINGTFNKDSRAMKATCKELGIKHTYTAIREYLAQTEAPS